MTNPEIKYASVVIHDEDRLLLACRPGLSLDLIGTELLLSEEPAQAAERALRELASISVSDLAPDGTVESMQTPVSRYYLYKGSQVTGTPRGHGGVDLAWYHPRHVLATQMPVSVVLGAVLYQINRH